VTPVDEPVCPISACSLTDKAITEIRHVDDSFHITGLESEGVHITEYTSLNIRVKGNKTADLLAK